MIFPGLWPGLGEAIIRQQFRRAGGRGQGAGRARNADSVDTELTGGDLGHGMGTLCSISPHYGPEQSSLSVFHAL